MAAAQVGARLGVRGVLAGGEIFGERARFCRCSGNQNSGDDGEGEISTWLDLAATSIARREENA